MKTINVTTSTRMINIGRQMETGVRQIVFDLSALAEQYGDGTAVLVHQRCGDTAPYIVTTEQEDSTVTWTVTNVDTAYKGQGKAEIRWTVDGALAKSIIFTTVCERSITADTTIPASLQSWYDAMIAYIDAHSGGSGSNTTYTISITDRTITLTGSDASEVSVTVPDTDLTDYMTESEIASAISTAVGAIVVPTKTSDLQNDSGFLTEHQSLSSYYTKTEVDSMIGDVETLLASI